MGGKESSQLKEQVWCSSSASSFCKSCVTEVENVDIQARRATPPIPKTDMQMILKDQQRKGANAKAQYKDLKLGTQNSLQSQQNTNDGYSTLNQLGNTQKIITTNHQLGVTYQAIDEQRFQGVTRESDERIAKLHLIVNHAPRLQLRVLSSAYLEKGEILMINALGLEDDVSLRQTQQDGFTYFGCKKSINKLRTPTTNGAVVYSGQMGATGTSNEQNNSGIIEKEIVNDFVIPTKNEDEKEKHRGRQFQIQFDLETQSFKIKDLGIGYGAFVKLVRPLVLRDNFLLNMGESYIVANLYQQVDESQLKLRLKIFSVVKADQPDVFSCSSEDQEIAIGRTPNCDIRIDDKLLSKLQATIRYEEGNWVLFDGYQGRESTNGTWLYLNEDCEIEDGMVFKSNQTFFEATLIL